MLQSLTCFKYRTPSAALHCLAEGALYFAKPEQLNDALEAKYDHASLDDFVWVTEQAYRKLNRPGGLNLELDERSRTKLAEAYARENQRLQAFTEQIGIFSAARRPDHQAMWAYYADNASGVCFELAWNHEVVNRHQIWVADVEYHSVARVHNRAEDWSSVLLALAERHPNASLADLRQLVLEEPARRLVGILSASRATSTKHTDWAHENEIRLLIPKAGAIPVLAEVLKRIYFVRTHGEHWGAIMQIIHSYYPSTELVQLKFSHGEIVATSMEIRRVLM